MIPNQQNHLSIFNTFHRGPLATLADAVSTVNFISITPRWLLL
jgi:hypothetical protein